MDPALDTHINYKVFLPMVMHLCLASVSNLLSVQGWGMCLDPMNAPSYEIARLGIQVRLARVLAFRLKGVGKCDGTSSQLSTQLVRMLPPLLPIRFWSILALRECESELGE